MASNVQATSARKRPEQLTHYLRKTVNFSDTNIATGISFANDLPAGAQVLRTTLTVLTAFNAVTTNVLTVGQNSTSYNDFVNGGDVDETAVGTTVIGRGADVVISADTAVFVKYTQTGTAATTGQARIVIEFVPDNDQ